MSHHPAANLALCTEEKDGSASDTHSLIYQPLDRSKSQFRVLRLSPGNPSDEITATIATRHLQALPREFNDKLHLSELTGIYDHLSTAISTGGEVQFEELLRWERLYAELSELYMIRNHKASDDKRLHFKEMFEQLMGRRDPFIDSVQRYRSKSCDPCEVDATQALINRLELICPSEKVSGPWTLNPGPSRDYVAVSYCCGDQTIQEEITLNDVRVPIPASAARALRGIRLETRWFNVWIDAVCINPNDSSERTHQVLLMSKIYSSADETIVWLESEGRGADDLLLSCATDFDRQKPANFPAESLVEVDSKVAEPTKSAVRKLCTSLLVYLKQPWFRRLWVYQEVLLSQHVFFQLGPVEITWNVMRASLQLYHKFCPAPGLWDGTNIGILGEAGPLLRRELDSEEGERDFEDTSPSLALLLLQTVPLKCFDPRDKVYALLGLTAWSRRRDQLPAELVPNYTLPIGECMRNATLASIREELNLDCLTLPVWTKRKPTWVVP